MMKKMLSLLLSLLIVLSLAACGATENSTPTDEGKKEVSSKEKDPSVVNYVDVSFSGVPMKIEGTDGLSCFVMDIRDGNVLLSLDEKHVDEETLFTYMHTERICIFSTAKQEIVAEWSPEVYGWYQAGVLTGEDSAVCAVARDPKNVFPEKYAFMRLDQEQTLAGKLNGELFNMRRLDADTILYSYQDHSTGEFGVRSIKLDEGTRDIFCLAGEEYEGTGGPLITCGDRFCFVYGKGGKYVMAVGTTVDGVLYETSFSVEDYTIDSFCLTPQGVVASVCKQNSSVHQLILLNQKETRVLIEKMRSPLYALRWCGDFMASIGYDFSVCIITADAEGNCVLTKPSFRGEIPEDDLAITPFSADTEGCCLYGAHEKMIYTAVAEPIED